jgi:uncharacterized membrane protein YeiH
VADHCAVGVSAVGGVLAARGKRVDLFGIVVVALVSALGGGTVRDWCLGDLPVLWIRDSSYLLTGAGTGLVTFFLARRLPLPQRGLLIADAFALALYTIVGASKALTFHASPAAAVALGVVTGVAGGMMRDVLLGEIPAVFRKEIHLYATAAFLGCVLFMLLSLIYRPEIAAPIGSAAILTLRLVSIRWKVGLPTFAARESG